MLNGKNEIGLTAAGPESKPWVRHAVRKLQQTSKPLDSFPTPRTAGTRNTPVTPDTPGTPDTPDSPATPGTPNTPNTPPTRRPRRVKRKSRVKTKRIPSHRHLS